jgi:putative ABC transport system permease protein
MIQSYFKIAYRNLIRHRAYSLINISGLAVGLSCVILISLFVVRESRYDSHNEEKDSLYRLIREDQQGDSKTTGVHTSSGEGDALSHEFPEVHAVCRFESQPVWISTDDKGLTRMLATADSTIFDVLTIPFLAGDPGSALRLPRTIVVTDEVARQYFGQEDPIGKTVILDHHAVSGPFSITGVVKAQPPTSTTKFDCLTTTILGERAKGWNYWDFNKTYAGGQRFSCC